MGVLYSLIMRSSSRLAIMYLQHTRHHMSCGEHVAAFNFAVPTGIPVLTYYMAHCGTLTCRGCSCLMFRWC
jgi:hypothetical protein